MNKDVVYIEPEDDITDILVNIKGAKHKIIALVPPKKAGVLRSAVNFKLIAKTAAQHEKTVVLITTDESLLRLAEKTKMPTAKSLQSKPHLPEMDDAEEYGENADDEDEEEGEEEKEEKSEAEKAEDEESAEDPEEEASKDDESEEKEKTTKKVRAVPAAGKKKPEIDMEIDGDKDDEDAEEKSGKKKSDKKKIHIPNFKKFRWPLLIGVVLIAAIIGFSYWAREIAPAAKITVKVKTTAANFNETVSFVTDQTKSDPEKGIFYIEQKSVIKQATDEFEATGEVDKGTKATGSITVTVKSPVTFALTDNYRKSFTVPAGTEFTNSAGNKYISTTAATLNVEKKNFEDADGKVSKNCSTDLDKNIVTCNISKNVTADIQLVAVENGDKYNFASTSAGWSFPVATVTTVKSSDITGGTSKIVKIVSVEDVDKAALSIPGDIDSDARQELSSQLSSDYIPIPSSFAIESTKITTSPAVNEEVNGDTKPKIIKENKYVIYAVAKAEIDAYIKAVTEQKISSDKTQTVYSTGVAMKADEEDKAFFESFKNDNGNMVAKLKSTTKTGPLITEDMVKEKSLGEKVGRVQSNLRSIKGVLDANVDTSYFFVTTVPEDENKVEIKITVDN